MVNLRKVDSTDFSLRAYSSIDSYQLQLVRSSYSVTEYSDRVDVNATLYNAKRVVGSILLTLRVYCVHKLYV